MDNAEAASGGAIEAQEPVQAQETQQAVTESIPAQVDSAENTDSLNTETESTKSAEEYEQLIKQKDAENARRRRKNEEQAEFSKRQARRIEELEANFPTLESVNGDYDRLDIQKQKHIAKIAYAESLKEESDYKLLEAADPIAEQSMLELEKANEVFHGKLNEYFTNGGTVTANVLNQKAAVVNEAIVQRSASEQALLIKELGSVNAAEVMLNLADNAALRYQIAHGTVFEALNAIHKAETRPKKISNAPEPVPEVDGGGGIPPSGDPSKAKTLSEYKASKARRK
jgi:hypothetical protein